FHAPARHPYSLVIGRNTGSVSLRDAGGSRFFTAKDAADAEGLQRRREIGRASPTVCQLLDCDRLRYGRAHASALRTSATPCVRCGEKAVITTIPGQDEFHSPGAASRRRPDIPLTDGVGGCDENADPESRGADGAARAGERHAGAP